MALTKFSFFGFWTTPSSAQRLLLTLYSGFAPGGPRGPQGVPGMEPGWAVCKASVLSMVLSLTPATKLSTAFVHRGSEIARYRGRVGEGRVL